MNFIFSFIIFKVFPNFTTNTYNLINPTPPSLIFKKETGGYPGGSGVKNLPAMQRPGFDPWVGKISWRRERLPPPVFLPVESPWTEEPGGLQSTGSQRVGHN